MLKNIIVALVAFLIGAIIGACDMALMAASSRFNKRLKPMNQSQQKEKDEIESVIDEPVTE